MTGNEKILVVDDTPTMRMIVKGMLEDLGFGSVTLAESAETALKLIANGGFELILADWNMSGRTGIELVRSVRARAESARLPIVMMTSNNDPKQISEARSAGASSYLVKPFGPADLHARMNEAFQSHLNVPSTLMDRKLGDQP